MRSTYPHVTGFMLLTLVVGCATPGPQAEPVYFPARPGNPRVVHLKSFNSLSELLPTRRSLLDWIRGGPASPHVGIPAGIAYRAGHLYVCDIEFNVLHDWDLTSGQAERLGSSAELAPIKPVAVAVDEPGTIYVADTGRGQVVAFDSTGRSTHRMRPPDRESYRPVAVAVHGTRLYVADIAGHTIDVFSTEEGRFLEALGRPGNKPGELYFPMGVATNGSGHVLVSDMMNARIQVFDAEHNPLSTFGQPGDRYGDLGKPKHIAVGPDGTILIADAEFARVHLFNAQGQLLLLVGSTGDEPGGTPMPLGVAVAQSLPEALASLVPADFKADYFFFVSNVVGRKRISLYAVGSAR